MANVNRRYFSPPCNCDNFISNYDARDSLQDKSLRLSITSKWLWILEKALLFIFNNAFFSYSQLFLFYKENLSFFFFFISFRRKWTVCRERDFTLLSLTLIKTFARLSKTLIEILKKVKCPRKPLFQGILQFEQSSVTVLLLTVQFVENTRKRSNWDELRSNDLR